MTQNMILRSILAVIVMTRVMVENIASLENVILKKYFLLEEIKW